MGKNHVYTFISTQKMIFSWMGKFRIRSELDLLKMRKLCEHPAVQGMLQKIQDKHAIGGKIQFNKQTTPKDQR